MNPALTIDASFGATPRGAAWEEGLPPPTSICRDEPLAAAPALLDTAEAAPRSDRLERLLRLSRQYQQSARR
jgi:hypothetical protein